MGVSPLGYLGATATMRIPTVTLLALLLAVGSTPGCDRVSDLLGTGPKTALASYLDATIRNDSEAAYGYISSQDQAVRTLADYKTNSGSELASAFAAKTSFTIIELQEYGDTAKAVVEITMPDLSGAFSDLLGSAFASALGGAKQEEIDKNLAQKYREAELPTTTKTEEFTLIREAAGWRVFLDWETTERISTLLGEAEDLKEQKKLHAALDKYDQVLELDSELVEAKQNREETRKEIAAHEEKQDYIDYIVLYDLEARYYTTYLDKEVPGVEFKMKNNGDRTLRKVKVTVYFKDASNAIIAEEDYLPVLVSEYSFGDNKPLRPNYIWQLEQGKFYTAKSVPSEWREGSVSAKITDIEFAK